MESLGARPRRGRAPSVVFEPFPPGEFPNLSDFVTEHAMQPGYNYANEFEYGLDLILDALDHEQARG